MSNKWIRYKNGNAVVSLSLVDGTKIVDSGDDDFIRLDFPTNIDMKITNRCNHFGSVCPWCHEGSTWDGKNGEILNQKIIKSLHPGTEISCGGGNLFEHPDLVPFLKELKEQGVIANITVHQNHFMQNFELIYDLYIAGLIHGIGVSLSDPYDQLFLMRLSTIPTTVIHVIEGIVTMDQLEALYDKNLKLLILGYKMLRRGRIYAQGFQERINIHSTELSQNLHKISKHFDAIAFDNLALEHLNVKDKVSEQLWESCFMGDEGTSTFYIDMVERKFGQSSTAPLDERYSIDDYETVEEMFNVVRSD